jgi:hypothetical protein
MTHETPPGPRGLAAQILAEAELSRQLEAYQGYSDNVWSMGRVADLLWRHSEPARPLIRKALVDALDEALQRGEMPMAVSDGVFRVHQWW